MLGLRRRLLHKVRLADERIVPDLLKDYSTRQNYVGHLAAYDYATRFAAGARVLDVGSGCGYGAYFLATAGAASVCGVDASAEAVRYAVRRYRHPRLCFERMDACALSYPGSSFDVVVSFQVLEHIEAVDRYLAEVHRVVRDDGLVILTTPNGDNPQRRAREANPFHVHEYSWDELETLLKRVFASVTVYVQVVTEEAQAIGARMERAAADSVLLRWVTGASPLRRVGRLVPLAWRNRYFVRLTEHPWDWYGVRHIAVSETYCDQAFKLLAVCAKPEGLLTA